MFSLVSIFGFDSYEIIPALGRSGGLFLMWNDNINIQVTLSNAHTINCLVLDVLIGKTWQLTFVYGSPIPLLRANFCDCLKEIGGLGR